MKKAYLIILGCICVFVYGFVDMTRLYNELD